MNGGANSSYCALNEHMIMYFVDEYKIRARAEEKIVDLLINLRYWYDIWPRARTYAQNCELVHPIPEGSGSKLSQ